jgi:hypothetical protein
MDPAEQVVAAELVLLLDRLATADQRGRGWQFSRREVSLLRATVAAAVESCDTRTIIHKITEHEERDDERDD